jgi:protein phosphatase PTC7
VKYRSPQQEHSFGHPYQLGHFEGADLPEDAMLTTMPLSPGDIVVLGSDGLWDNVGEEELVEEVGRDVVEGEGGWGHTRITAPSLIV